MACVKYTMFFKPLVIMVKLMMLCKDEDCSKPLTNSRIFLQGDKLMIDRSETFNGKIYLLIKDKVMKNTYIVSVYLDILEMVSSGAFTLKKLDEDESDDKSKNSTETEDSKTDDDKNETLDGNDTASEESGQNNTDVSKDSKSEVSKSTTESLETENSENTDSSGSGTSSASESGDSGFGGEDNRAVGDKLKDFLKI